MNFAMTIFNVRGVEFSTLTKCHGMSQTCINAIVLFYVTYLRFIVAHFMALRCGKLTLYILKMYAYVGIKLYIRRIVNVPYTAHTWMLGPILNQTHISTQSIKICIWFLFGMAISHNIFVYTCYKQVLSND